MTWSTYTPRKRRLLTLLIVLVILVAFGAWFTWYKFFREVPQPAWVFADGETRFKYGSIGGENDVGVPYWILYVLPRMFPEKIPKPGGLMGFGVNWEEGKELPIGFVKKTIGFDRVGQNCAACHTTRLRLTKDSLPIFYPTGPNHTFDLEAFFRFVVDCAKDPRFNPDTMMSEINLAGDLSFVDQLIYRFVLIPLTKKRLLEREPRFAWIYRKDFPEWGRGRDDAMNLTKYFLTTSPMDNTTGPTDMPSVWNLNKYYRASDMRLNFAGDSYDAHSVIIDSALGLVGAAPVSNDVFLGEVKWLQEYLGKKKAPKFPFPIDAARANAGRAIFVAHCARCHESQRTGTVVPLAEAGTDKERVLSWNGEAAVRANQAVEAFGIKRRGLVEADPTGYIAAFLDGIWLRAPYLHNGSVPTLRDLLNPVAQRPVIFYRGYDVYDPVNVGFITQGPDAESEGTKFDVRARACGNFGHEHGVNLPADQKDALLEYLKTL
jgi:mono/diheme cytochrome c family protein